MVYHLNSGIGTAPLQNSSYTTPIVPEIPAIEAQNNRGFWLPVTIVVISRPLLYRRIHVLILRVYPINVDFLQYRLPVEMSCGYRHCSL